ncbi:MAG: MFS transporter [Gemmatimonadetes bacterium]|nr:MFS transporter [Gemmatimonadota bacterium]
MTGTERVPRSAIVFLAANVLFGSGLFFHAFLYNFYLDKLGWSPAVMGRAAAALTTGGLVSLLPAGWLVDRVGARWGLLLAGAIGAAGLAAGAVTTATVPIYLAAAVAGAGTALWRVAQAPTLMTLAPPAQRSRVFSWNVGLIIGSGAVGVAIAGATPGWLERAFGVEPLTALRGGLAIGALGTVVSLILFALLRLPGGEASDTIERTRAGVGAATVLSPPAAHLRMLTVVGLIGVWMLAPALVAPFFNLYFFKTFSLSMDRIGMIFGVVHGLWALIVLASGELATRYGVSRVVAGWLFLLGPALVLLPIAGAGVALALYFLQGLAQPAANPLIDQILMERSAPERRGSISSWRNVAADGSAIAGASLGGWVLATGSFSALFVTAGIIGAAAALPLAAGLRKLAARVP